MSENHHPFGINPTDTLVNNTIKKVRELYEDLPETTCCHRGLCCKAGCPNMYYCEFLNVRRSVVDGMSKKERLELTMSCIRTYLYGQQEKQRPCVFLNAENKCKIYSARHVKCRLYGLIPEWTYKRNVKEISDELNVTPESLPLCTQCDQVKVKPEFKNRFPRDRISETTIKNLEKKLRELDRELGMKKDIQEDGFGFLTYHDWHLLFEFGDVWLARLTPMRQKLNEQQKEQFLEALKKALEAQGI